MTNTTLASQNQAWGFFGTMHSGGYDAQAAWDAAFASIRDEVGPYDHGIRDFLDSRGGRHFADTVCSNMHKGDDLDSALINAIAEWQGWKIGRRTSREYGIPAEFTYLTGWVMHFDILDEARA